MKFHGAVPVNATERLVLEPEHTVAVPLKIAVANVFIVTVAVPVRLAAGAEHPAPSLKAVILYVVVAAGDTVIKYGELVIPVTVTGVTPLL